MFAYPGLSGAFLDFTSNIRLTQLEKLGEEFQHPVAELCRQIFIGSRHHYLDKLTTRKKEQKISEVADKIRDVRIRFVLAAEQIPERKEFLHCFADLAALKLLFKVLKAFLKDRLIQTTLKKINK